MNTAVRDRAASILLDRCSIDRALLRDDFDNIAISDDEAVDAYCAAGTTYSSIGSCLCKIIGQLYVNYHCTIVLPSTPQTPEQEPPVEAMATN